MNELKSLRLEFTDDAVLRNILALVNALDKQIAFIEAKIAAVAVNNERVKLLMTMPGLARASHRRAKKEIGMVRYVKELLALMSCMGLAILCRM